MTDALLTPSLRDAITRLGRMFVWNRRRLSGEVIEELDARQAQFWQEAEALRRLAVDATTRADAMAEEFQQSSGELARLRPKLTSKKQALESLSSQHEELVRTHGETWSRFRLVTDILAVRPRSNRGLARFHELLTNDYMQFAESESSLGAEAKAQAMLHSIERELAFRTNYPDVFQRTIIGVAGGFSSGKSAFINSFIRDDAIRLPVGIQPVTAIPSYVLSIPKPAIRGYPANGGFITLDQATYRGFSHAFINSFGFDLKAILPFMSVGVPMDHKHVEHICFVDTPGYNPPTTAGEYTRSDKQTALDYSRQADALIWVVGLDANGTMPDSDLDFLHSLGVEQVPIQIVLSKAELRSDDDIESILDEVEGVLQDNSISYSGVSAYSSIRKEERAFRGASLTAFLASQNMRRDAVEHLRGHVAQVFDMYDTAIRADIASRVAKSKAANRLELRSLAIGGEDVAKEISKGLRTLRKDLQTDELKACLDESSRLRAAFFDAVDMALVDGETDALN
ncbi:hypothetical protein [Luteimonas sp. MC1572]|uniref:hypothetical protein n=1 Tax=Luteimonas sp. MC1572 TaxID=2799325 RepID=UPI0018F0A3BB|nr:hypothetical protein [Luteimonas sp. MC1572]MBJ6980344.1 hypothetical protein [Luteimonas sp. MC1572]QQO04230.1 hypothetical protein JGR64_05655 [Luteimonas sp. MC1572]